MNSAVENNNGNSAGAGAPRSLAEPLRFPLLAYFAMFFAHKKRLALAAALAVVKHSPVIFVPLYTRMIIDTAIPMGDLALVGLCVMGMSALIVVNLCLHPLAVKLYSSIRRDVALRLRSRLCERLQQLALSYYDNSNSGRLHSKVMQDVEKLETLGKIMLDPFLMVILSSMVALAIVAYMQPVFLVLILAFLPLVFLQRAVLSRRVQQSFQNLRLEQEKLNAEVGEMIDMIGLSRAHGTENEDLRRVGARLGQVRNVGVGVDWSQNLLQSQMWGTTQFLYILVVVLGAVMAIHGKMTIGEIILFLSLVMMSLGGVQMVLGQLETLFAASEAMRSIDEVMRHPEIEVNDGKPAFPALSGRVELRDAWFAYPGGAKPVLQSITLDVEPNQTIALVGPSGAGKSTFIKLLLGFYEPIQGEVAIDGHALGDYDKRTFRRQVGVVTQETFLFNGTIFQNITHGLGDVPIDRVREAAQRAYADEFIDTLELGYRTEIGDRGLRLSGGQKQRIAIARALLRDPRLLILDEATSALDSQSERVVQKALEELMRDRTTFVIAHRLSTVRNADRILVFENGKIVEDGRHDGLLKNGGLYARLVELQEVG